MTFVHDDDHSIRVAEVEQVRTGQPGSPEVPAPSLRLAPYILAFILCAALAAYAGWLAASFPDHRGEIWASGSTIIAALLGASFTRILFAILMIKDDQPLGRLVLTRITEAAVCGLAALTGLLAGREGPALRQDLKAHLAGESGHDPLTWAKAKEAAGFVIAAARYRGQEWADAAWKPVDAVLRSRFLSGLFVTVPTVVDALEVMTHKGTTTVLTSFSSIFGLGAALAGAVAYGRKRRGVKPPPPKPRPASNDDGQDY